MVIKDMSNGLLLGLYKLAAIEDDFDLIEELEIEIYRRMRMGG